MTAQRLLLKPVLFALLLLVTAPAGAQRVMEDGSTVVLRTVDKVSARTHTYEVPVDKTIQFGTSLFIKARACRKSSPLDKPESAAFLQIWERKPNEEQARWIFSGWMFASSPSISPMEHPVYDVWVIDCKKAVTAAKSQEFSSEAVPAEKPAPDTSAKDAPPVASSADAPAPEVEEEAPPAAEDIPERPAAPAPALEQMPSSFENDGE